MPMIYFLYGRHYDIHVLRCEPKDSGLFATSRLRVYVILAHRGRTEMIANPERVYGKISREIQSRVKTSPQDYLVSDNLEVLDEAQQLARVRKRRSPKATWMPQVGVVGFANHRFQT